MSNSPPSSASDVLDVDANVLPRFPRESRSSGFLLYASCLSGLIVPLAGNVGAPYLIQRFNGPEDEVFQRHWQSIRRSQIRWGVAIAIVYLLCGYLGVRCLPLVLAVVIPWTVFLVISACQAEDGKAIQRIGPWT